MFDKENVFYEVLIYDYVSSIGGFRRTPIATRIFKTEEEAVAFARSKISELRKIEIKQTCRIVNWQ